MKQPPISRHNAETTNGRAASDVSRTSTDARARHARTASASASVRLSSRMRYLDRCGTQTLRAHCRAKTVVSRIALDPALLGKPTKGSARRRKVTWLRHYPGRGRSENFD